MCRTSAVLLMFAVGLVSAGNEQWVGTSAQVRYDIPNPEVGVFPKGPELFASAVDTFRYDDGIPVSAWAWTEAGNGWGMKFISPADDITLAGALMHFQEDWPVPGGDRAMVKVFADDGPGGAPGTELWSSDTLTVVRGQWNYIPIDRQILGTDYYIFYVQADAYPACPGFSIDGFNNAPSGTRWTYMAGGFAEDFRTGEWLVRAVVEWDRHDVDASALFFASNMPVDTAPGINLFLQAMVKNLGNDDLPAGTPVKLMIAGPQGYVHEQEARTATVLVTGEERTVGFEQPWQVPDVAGPYNIRVWTEAAGEQWPANDTIAYDLGVAGWLEYYDWYDLRWLTWEGPERAVRFNPADLEVQYPVGLIGLRHTFYRHPQYPWPDSSFRFKVYAEDGHTLLYESDVIEARPGMPGPPTVYLLDTMLVFRSGEFHVSVAPVDTTGHPSSCADGTSQRRSIRGSPGAWLPFVLGEYFTSASVLGGVGISEGDRRYANEPSLSLSGYPNPVSGFVTVRWNLPRRQAVEVNLYDATGRPAKKLYSAGHAPLNGAVQLDTRALPAGIYLLRLEAADGSATRKLVLAR